MKGNYFQQKRLSLSRQGVFLILSFFDNYPIPSYNDQHIL